MRRLSGVIVLLLLGVLLVACGTDEEDPEPTEAPPPVVETEPTEDADVGLPATVTAEETAITSPVAEASTPAAVEETPATPDTPVGGMMDASPAASPAEEDVIATPQPSPMAGGAATMTRPESSTPVAATVATPVASPMATPSASPDSAAAGVPVSGEENSPPEVMELSGTIELAGVQNEAYILTDEGCVGLGQYDDLRDGRQVVVRNASGTIISVTELDAVRSDDSCAWSFVVSAPESDFYSISVPMVFEQVFPRAQVMESGGEVVIELP